MAKNNQYYDISAVLKTHAQYIMLLSERSSGKSYQVKKTIIENAYNKINSDQGESDGKFVYLRRWERDLIPSETNIVGYFGDVPIKKWTKGEYDCVVYYQGALYFGIHDEEGKKVRGPMIGRACALNLYERYKSQTFIGYDYIVYEEFITDKLYMNDEPRLLQQFISTVARLKEMQVFLIGNTLSRVCPYFAEWSLQGVLKQKIGTIEIYKYHVGDSIIKMAVERCKPTEKKNSMFFGEPAKQIVSGEWDTFDMPKLPKELIYYDKVYELLVEFQSFKFCIQLLADAVEGGLFCYVYPFTGARHIDRRISEEFSTNPFVSSRLNPQIKPEAYIINSFRTNKVCYSDNLTGTDFGHVLASFKFA